MTSLGLGLVLFTIAMMVLICILHWFIKPSIKKQRILYASLVLFSIAWIIYFIVLRWSFNIQNLIDEGGIPGSKDQLNWFEINSYRYSYMISKVLLLDLCPFMALVFPITIIISGPSLKIARTIAPAAMFGGFITVFFGCAFDSLDETSLAEYIFIGAGNNKLYFLMHFIILILGLIVYLNSPRFTWKSTLAFHLFMIGYLLYVFILMKTLNLTNNVTGEAYGDWFPIGGGQPEYGAVVEFLPLDYPSIMWVSYLLIWIVFILLIVGKHFATQNPTYKLNFINLNIVWYKKHVLKIESMNYVQRLFNNFKSNFRKRQTRY